MITAYAVKDIKDKLREIGNAPTKNWGIDDAKAETNNANIDLIKEKKHENI